MQNTQHEARHNHKIQIFTQIHNTHILYIAKDKMNGAKWANIQNYTHFYSVKYFQHIV